jgi:peptidyl-prolyl cis-trans isomerase SurA
MSRRLRIFLTFACSLFASHLLILPTVAQAEIIERILATVNEDIITQTDLEHYAEQLRNGGLSDDLLIPDEATKEAVLKDHAKLLQKMIDAHIIDSEVKKQNLSVPLERVEQEIRGIAKRNGISRDDLKAAVEEKGIKFSKYQDFIKTGLERQSLIEKSITSKIRISEDDVLSQYSITHNDSTDQLFEYTLEHILFLNEKGGPARARERAEFVLKKLRDGGSFEKLASEYSEDPNFTSGGMLGTFKSGEFSRELEGPVQKLAVDDISGIVQTKAGFHILKLVKKHAIPDPKSEKEKEKIRNELYEKSYKKQFQSWLEQLHQDAFIRINQGTLGK